MPKYISLAAAHSILENCAAVIWGDDFLSYPSVSDLEAKESSANDFLYLKCEDEDGQIFTASFIQNENERVLVAGSSMFLTNDEGEEIQISILTTDENVFEKCEDVGPQIFE